MKCYLTLLQEKIEIYGGFSEILKKYRFINLIDFILSSFLTSISRKLYLPKDVNYGLIDALFWPRGIDRWFRYTRVIKEIDLSNRFSVLNVGSGGVGISGFLNSSRMDVISLDIRKEVFKNLRGFFVIGDGCRLPFKNKSFDVVVSIDVLEHIPCASFRQDFYEELKRVCGEKLVLACPIQSEDGLFRGRVYDLTFQRIYKQNHGCEEQNTAEHIASGHPTIGEIERALPNSKIYGYKNCDTWLKYMLFQQKLLIGLFTGLIYYMFWKRNDNQPPYWGGIIVWTQNSN